jgi:hypothetical protein
MARTDFLRAPRASLHLIFLRGHEPAYGNVKEGAIYNNEEKHQAALRWLSEKARLHRKTHLVARGAFFILPSAY